MDSTVFNMLCIVAGLHPRSGTNSILFLCRLDRDPGFVEGRQYGRGKSGGQVYQILYREIPVRVIACASILTKSPQSTIPRAQLIFHPRMRDRPPAAAPGA